MLTAIDQWIGRKLMQPVIIGLCQRSGMTQYAVARYAWMLAMWTLIMRISFEGVGNWLFAVLVIGMSVWETIQAATRPNMPMRSNEPLRKVILIFAAFDALTLAVRSYTEGFHGFSLGQAWDMCALTAEYAKTITTIPPKQSRTSSRRHQRA